MSMLKDLYHGKSGFFGEHRINTPEFILQTGKVADIEEKLENNHPEIKELFEKFQDAQSTATSIA